MLSVVIPAYNEEQMIRKAADRVSTLLEKEKIEYEILFVDDGSDDRTWQYICYEGEKNEKIKGICLSRNFGKESALFAGLAQAGGDCVVVIDCDLQHPPEKIIEMYRLWENGYEIVEGMKRNRGKESGMHTFAAKCFYRIISQAAHMDLSHASDFKLLDRKAVNVLLNMPEKNAFFRALSSWIGFKTTQVEYDVREREAGETKWSTKSLFRYAITNVTSFTAAPMQIITILGIIMFMVTTGLTITALYQKITGKAQGGFTTVIILQCFTGSVIMISLGIVGYYIAKIYDEIKGRPRYIVSERKNCEEKKQNKFRV
ncbi:MAG: glycosyltransferase family 2 protein [Eubacterium sp.]|nr:glycosyltransferase family 2 protein [Eubacterium sp.]MDD7210455.1 glycosyltransferase family 2 protein [Lachnospiraceae bacterium]MDY5497211.1 glycosyltransferase family 2 protein [Anaerobutyricum sp.]